VALGSVSTAEVLIPSLDELFLSIDHDRHYLSQFVSCETLRCRQLDWVKPELRQLALVPDMNVWRFVSLVAVEEEPVLPNDSDSRHVADSRMSIRVRLTLK
jgi:hypothetical protein